MQRTFYMNHTQIEKNWFIIDAGDLIVGRLAVEIVKILRGKNKVEHTPHLNCGDNVVVINADQVSFSGRKLSKKVYYRHTGYIGHLKEIRACQIIEGKRPEQVLELSVKRMLGKGPLARRRLGDLYIYSGAEHPHEGQQPKLLDFSKYNAKNSINRSKRV